jgi:hypothetical protein
MLVRDACTRHAFPARQLMAPMGTVIAKANRQQDMIGPELSISPHASFGTRGATAKAIGGFMSTPMPEAHESAVSGISMDGAKDA